MLCDFVSNQWCKEVAKWKWDWFLFLEKLFKTIKICKEKTKKIISCSHVKDLWKKDSKHRVFIFSPDETFGETSLASTVTTVLCKNSHNRQYDFFTWCNIWRNLFGWYNFCQILQILLIYSLQHIWKHHIHQVHGISTKIVKLLLKWQCHKKSC